MLTRLPSDMSGRAGQGLVHWRVWHGIAQERAAIEAELSETRGDTSPFPVVATHPEDEEEDDAQHPGIATVTQEEDAASGDDRTPHESVPRIESQFHSAGSSLDPRRPVTDSNDSGSLVTDTQAKRTRHRTSPDQCWAETNRESGSRHRRKGWNFNAL
jgi:hypothetical protein